MKISIRHRRTYSLAVFCALTSVFLILYGCGDDDNGGGGTVAVPNSISGQVTWNGSGLSGVHMKLDGATISTIVTTNASGNYTFTGLNNGSYTLTPNKPDVTFNPTSSPQTVSGPGITGVNFAATATKAGPFIISGSVSSAGSGLIGVTMTLTGASSATITTDPYNFFEFSGLANGNYTITPSKTGFTFSPTSSTQTVSGADLTGVTFTATPVQAVTHSISGNVVSVATFSGVPGVTMALSGTSSDNAITDARGDYTFTGLANGTYTITPSRTGLTFGTTSSTQTLIGLDITGVNFTAIPTQKSFNVLCPASGTTNVTIQDFSFAPDNVTISPNGIVKWTNTGTTHTVTGGPSPIPNGWFSTGNIGTGASTCIQFLDTGTYDYFCTIHPSMIGKVVVQ